jgi:hypothetical protein
MRVNHPRHRRHPTRATHPSISQKADQYFCGANSEIIIFAATGVWGPSENERGAMSRNCICIRDGICESVYVHLKKAAVARCGVSI